MQVNGTHLTMIRGDTEALTIRVVDAPGAAIPLVAGDTVYLTVKRSVKDKDHVLQKIVTEFNEGIALVEIQPDDTKPLTFRSYVYDVQITFADGTVKTIIPPSTFEVAAEVTDD